MKRFTAVLASLLVIISLTTSAFAAFKDVFDEMPSYTFDSTDFETGKTYVLTVKPSINSDDFYVGESLFHGARTVVTDVKALSGDIVIGKIKEDNDFNFLINIMPKEQGKFQLQITFGIYGYDESVADYNLANGSEWTYVITTEEYTVEKGEPVVSAPDIDASNDSDTSSNVSSGDKTTESNITSSNGITSSAIQVDVDDSRKGSAWMWWIVAIAAVAVCAVIGVVLYRNKIKR